MLIDLTDIPVAFFVERDRAKMAPYGEELIIKAYTALCLRNLRYSSTSGVTRDRNGELSRYTRSEDTPLDYTIPEIAEYCLEPFVRNSASRLYRGFDA